MSEFCTQVLRSRVAKHHVLTCNTTPDKGDDMVSARGGRHGFVYPNRHDVYRALRRQGKSKEDAAQIANAGHTKLGRTTMAKKAAATRRGKLTKPFRAR